MISIIIPALNEEIALPRTLASIVSQEAAHEILISDGGSTDRTLAIAQAAGASGLPAPRGRGAQMNAGARLARGEWLLFLHADTLLPPGALNAIRSLPPHVAAGGFHQAFSPAPPLLRMVSRLHNWRCKRTHIIYGDQAMFVRRAVFEALGGFPETDLEDVKFSEQLRKHSVPVMLPDTVVTDARKFLKQGILRSMGRIVLLLLCHRYNQPLLGRRFFDAVR